VRWITHAQAQTFCAWAGGRLPTAAEYTRAAQADAFFPGVAAATKKGDACNKANFQPEGCPLYAKMDFRVDDAIYPMGVVPEDVGPFGHHDLYGMSTWTRTALLLPEITVCKLTDGAPDFVSDEPTYGPNPSRVIGHFATYVRQASTEFGQSHMTDPVPQVGVRCAF
jgi:hypothetical protein